MGEMTPAADGGNEAEDTDVEMLSQAIELCEKIENDGRDITELIGKIVVRSDVDPEIVDILQQEMVSQLVEVCGEHDEIDTPEVALGLWYELRRVNGLVQEAMADSEEEPDDSPGEGLEARTDDQLEASDEESPADVMFQ